MRKITTDELIGMRERGDQFALINVLPTEKFAQTKIPDARNIPIEEPNFASRVEQALGGKDWTVVVYCANESCPASTTAAEQLEAAGFPKVYDYKGGAEAWQQSQEAVEATI